MTLTFEDFPPGRYGTFGPRHVTRDEILAFAAEFDPQPMHLDEEAASKSMLRGLSGSGWHLCSLMMRMMADGFITRAASLGSPGVDEVRWLSPLRPGDDLMKVTANWSETEAEPVRLAPRLNEHGAEILREIGYSADEIAAMIWSGCGPHSFAPNSNTPSCAK